MLFVVSGFPFELTVPKDVSGIPSECQTAWIQIRPNVLSSLIVEVYQQSITIVMSG